MTSKDYVEYVFLDYIHKQMFDNLVKDQWIFSDEIVQTFRLSLKEAFARHGYDIKDLYSEVALDHINGLIQSGGIISEGDEFTGTYLKVLIPEKDAYVSEQMSRNQAAKTISVLGNAALVRALHKISAAEGWKAVGETDKAALDNLASELVAPASDRVVSFSDNQIEQLDVQTTEIIEAVASQNQVGDTTGIREIILGQLKAGRELIRAGSFKLHLMELALFESLRFLATKYEREAIGVLATTLLELLIKHIGIGA